MENQVWTALLDVFEGESCGFALVALELQMEMLPIHIPRFGKLLSSGKEENRERGRRVGLGY